MSYSNSWDSTLPLGGAAASTADNEFRKFRVDVEERMNHLVGGSWADDDPVYLAPPLYAKAYRNGAGTLPTGAWTNVEFDAESFDTDSLHDIVTNSERFNVPTTLDGTRLVRLHFQYACFMSVAGLYGVRITKNAGAVLVAECDMYVDAGAAQQTIMCTTIDQCVADDYYTFQAYQASGAAKSFVIGVGNIFATIEIR